MRIHFGAFAPTMTSQHLPIQAIAHLLLFGHNLKGEFWDTQILGVWSVTGELGGRELRQSKAHPLLPNTSQRKVLLFCQHLAGIPMSNYAPPQFNPHFGGLGYT